MESTCMARVVVEGPCVYFPDGACGAFNPMFPGGNHGGSYPACKFTYIDRTGRVLTKDRFDFARNFPEGLAPVRVGTQWGFIDKTGAMVVSPRFEDAEPFASGLSRIRDHRLYGYADKTGSVRIKTQFKYAEDFSDGLAVVGDGDSLYWYIDNQGGKTIPGEFADASPFFKGLANVRLLESDVVKAKAQYAYIDKTGRRVFTY